MTQLVLVTGLSGSGKSALSRYLTARGERAVSLDAHPGLCRWENSDGQPGQRPEQTGLGRLRVHRWVWQAAIFADLVTDARAIGATWYLCGTATNQQDLFTLCDTVVWLNIDHATMRTRVTQPGRTNPHGTIGDTLVHLTEPFDPEPPDGVDMVIDAREDIDTIADQILTVTGPRGAIMYDDHLADVYDLLYATGRGKDYKAEAAHLGRLIRDRYPTADSVLDVGCGTGRHLNALARHFTTAEGVELSDAMRRKAVALNPDLRIHAGDMRTMNVYRTYDAVTCLFAVIGYAATAEHLADTCQAMARHLNPGGVLIIEPWFAPDEWIDNSVHHTVASEGDRTVVRMSHSTRTGRISRMTCHYLVGVNGSPAGVDSFSDEHVMGLHTEEEYRQALTAAGITDIERVDGWTAGRYRLLGHSHTL